MGQGHGPGQGPWTRAGPGPNGPGPWARARAHGPGHHFGGREGGMKKVQTFFWLAWPQKKNGVKLCLTFYSTNPWDLLNRITLNPPPFYSINPWELLNRMGVDPGNDIGFLIERIILRSRGNSIQ